MKTLFILLFVGFSACANAQSPAAYKDSIQLYPQLSDPASELNRSFLARAKKLKSNNDPLLKTADWPSKLAWIIERELDLKYHQEGLHEKAESGDKDAQLHLAEMYDFGYLCVNTPEAIKWYRKAAEQGSVEAQKILGSIYEIGIVNRNGIFEHKDITESAKWYLMAANQGDAYAQARIGLMYLSGEGVPKNDKEAAKWCLRSAKQGDAQGQLYMCGRTPDFVESYMWLLLSAAQGNETAKKQVDEFEKLLTPAQRARGQEMAQMFKPIKEASPK